MSINVINITDAEAATILSKQEGHTLDFKARQIAPGSLTKHISAFANAEGGEIFIGIAERGTNPISFEWSGFHDAESANQHIDVFERLFPLGMDFRYEFLAAEKLPGIVLHVEIAKTRTIVTTQDESVYIRRGAQSLRVTDAQHLATLARAKGLTSFETEPVNVTPEVITDSDPIRNFMTNVVPHADPRSWLQKQRMIVEGKPTVAGVILFADEPQAILPKRASVKIYRYKTRDEGSR